MISVESRRLLQATANDSSNGGAIDAKLYGQRSVSRCRTTPDAESPNVRYIFCGELCSPWHSSVSLLHVQHVLLVRAFDNVAGIKAGRVIASMSSLRFRPAIMGEKKCQSMNLYVFSAEPAMTVSISVLNKGPEQAGIAFVGREGLNQPLGTRDCSPVKLVGHRRSLTAKVFGECAFTSASPFDFTTVLKEHS